MSIPKGARRTRAPFKLILSTAPQTLDGRTQLTPAELKRYAARCRAAEELACAASRGGMTDARILARLTLLLDSRHELMLVQKRKTARHAASLKACPYTQQAYDTAAQANGKKTAIARALGVTYRTLRKYGRPTK